MTTEPATEAVLSLDDLRKILAICSPTGLLVGGQALAFWSNFFNVERPSTLAVTITADADFIGDSELARKLARKLRWTLWVPSLDDATSQTGKVTHSLKDGRVKQVDFLSGVIGLGTRELARRAVEIELPDVGRLRVIHPLDVLDSRIQNLHLLEEKRTTNGIAQGQLAVAVARAFMHSEIGEKGERTALKSLERVAEISSDVAALKVFLRYGIDALEAIPIERFKTTGALHEKRWPQICELVARKRNALRRVSAPKP